MGWKSTADITRSKAKSLIMLRMMALNDMTDQQLSNILEGFGFGDDPDLAYYGFNFHIIDEEDEKSM
jgi:hypothetical protein